MLKIYTSIDMPCLIVVLCFLLPCKMVAAEPQLIADQFQTMVSAKGTAYVEKRNAILARGQAALPFLQGQAKSEDWQTRVIAKAVASRLERPELLSRYEMLSITTIVNARGQHVIRMESLAQAAGAFGRPSQDPELVRSGRTGGIRLNDVPFLIEVALKGSILHKPTVSVQMPEAGPDTMYDMTQVADMLGIDEELARMWMANKAFHEQPGGSLKVRHSDLKAFVGAYLWPEKPENDAVYAEDARCWAIIKLGDFCEDQDAVKTLETLLFSSEPTRIRAYAAIALGLSGQPTAIDLLKKAEGDQDPVVARHAASSGERLQAMLARMERRGEQEFGFPPAPLR